MAKRTGTHILHTLLYSTIWPPNHHAAQSLNTKLEVTLNPSKNRRRKAERKEKMEGGWEEIEKKKKKEEVRQKKE